MDLEKRRIVEELGRIRASREFSSKPVMRELLAYLVTEHLEGRSAGIKGYTIALHVFGQGDDFDADRNPLVRVNVGRLRGLLRTYYLDEGSRSPLRIEIPKGTYVPRITKNNGNKTHAAGTTRDELPPAVAVPPFRNLTDDKGLDYLAVGLAQDLSDALTKFDDFRVIGMQRRLEDGDSSAPDADPIRSKNIRFLLDGDIQASNGRVKVGVRLIDTVDDSSLWGDRFLFDVANDDLFAFQEGITRKVAGHIGGEYGKINQRRYENLLESKPRSLNEQDVLLKFYHFVNVLTQESAFEFERAALEALEKEPDSCLLNNFAANVYSNIYSLDLAGAEEALGKFEHYAEKAYAINPKNQLVRGTLAFKCFLFDERERFFNLLEEGREWTAISPIRLGGFALYTCFFGEWERGKKMIDEIFDNNAHVPGWLHATVSLYHYRRREYEDALAAANKCQIPGLHWGHINRIVALGQLGRLEEARSEFEALLQTRPNFVERGRYLMGILIKEPDLLEHMLDGFGTTGVEID